MHYLGKEGGDYVWIICGRNGEKKLLDTWTRLW